MFTINKLMTLLLLFHAYNSAQTGAVMVSYFHNMKIVAKRTHNNDIYRTFANNNNNNNAISQTCLLFVLSLFCHKKYTSIGRVCNHSCMYK